MFAIPFIIFIIFFVVFLIIGLSIFRSHRHNNDTMQNMINTVSAYAENQDEDSINSNNDILQDQTKTCEYCGATMPVNSAQCDSCGAKVKKN